MAGPWISWLLPLRFTAATGSFSSTMPHSVRCGIWIPAFLEGHPEDGAVLDALRAARKLPEQADYRVWRNKMLESYQSLEAKEKLVALA